MSSQGDTLQMMPWFPRDFIAATRHLALAERGAYRELLDHQWEMGSLPSDEVRLARMLGIPVEEFKQIWLAIRCKFDEQPDGSLLNNRLEEHRKKAVALREKKVGGAHKTNAKRYGKKSDTVAHSDTQCATHSVSHCVSDSGSPPSPSPSISKKEDIYMASDAERSLSDTQSECAPRETDAEVFEHIQTIKAKYPEGGREDWVNGERNARQLVLDGEATWQQLEDGVERYKRYCRATNRTVMSPGNFFGAPDRPWSQRWIAPKNTRERTRDENIEAGIAWLEKSSAQR